MKKEQENLRMAAQLEEEKLAKEEQQKTISEQQKKIRGLNRLVTQPINEPSKHDRNKRCNIFMFVFTISLIETYWWF